MILEKKDEATYTLNLKLIMSPSLTSYVLPSSRSRPFSRAAGIVPTEIKASNEITSALINPLSISE
jgi:hypothetical protein